MKILFLPLLLTFLKIASSQEIEAIAPAVKNLPPRGEIPRVKFSVVTPNTIRRERPFNAYVRGYNLKEPVHVNLTLASTINNGYEVTYKAIISKEDHKATVEFDTSLLPIGQNDYQFTVTTKKYNETKKLLYISKENSFFIQLSKPVYFAEDLIQFRVFSIDSESNAYNPRASTLITLTDAKNNELIKFNNVTFVNGKYEGTFLLPSKPNYGSWNLQIQYNGETINKAFKVSNYVQPFVFVSLSAPDIVSISSSKFFLIIKAESTFLQPVSGNAVLTFLRVDDQASFTKNVTLTPTAYIFEIDIKRDLNFNLNEESQYTISVVFYDPLSNSKATAERDVLLVPYNNIVQIIGDNYFKSDRPYFYKVAVKNLDGTPAPKGTRVNVNVKTQSNDVNFPLTTKSDGLASGKVHVNTSIEYFEIQATCNGCSNDIRAKRNVTNYAPPTTEPIKLYLLSSSINPDDEIEFQASVSEDDIDGIIYFVTSKGVLLESAKVYFEYDVQNFTKVARFTINSDFRYAPLFKIYAYYLRESDWTYVSTYLDVKFKQKLPNYLTLSLPNSDTVKPTKQFNLIIETIKYSTVSLYAIDQRVLLLGDDQSFTFDDIVKNLEEYRGQFSTNPKPPCVNIDNAENAGLLFFTNIPPIPTPFFSTNNNSEPFLAASSSASLNSLSQINKKIIQSFLWQDVIVNNSLLNGGNKYDNRGREIISVTAPNSIASYVIFGVSMNKFDGMGLTDLFPSITVFLPLILAMELPFSVKSKETLLQDITIFNNLRQSQKTIVTFFKDSRFEIIDAGKYGWSIVPEGYRREVISDPGSITVQIAIKPLVGGYTNLKVTAEGPLAGDSTEKVLRVIPDGILRTITSSAIISVRNPFDIQNTILTCSIPPFAYQDFTEVFTTVIADILGKPLNNLGGLITTPWGCGEQNLLGLVPDVVIYKYLIITNQLTPTLRISLTDNIFKGYLNQLNYRGSDGGFSAWGRGTSSTWLTSYAIWAFYMSKDIISISPQIIQSALNFILRQQTYDGSFREPGRVIHTEMQGGTGSGIAMTAYVAIVLNDLSNSYPEVIVARDKALNFLAPLVNSTNDAYRLGVIANALQGSKSGGIADLAFNKFFTLRKESLNEVYWQKGATFYNQYYGPRSIDVETTAYGLRVMTMRRSTSGIKVVKYLTSIANQYGGFGSSQDTVMAILALCDYAAEYSLNHENLTLTLTPDIGNKLIVNVNKINALTLQKFQLDDKVRRLSILPANTGFAIVSLICNYYEDPTKVKQVYRIRPKFLSVCRYRLEINICVAYNRSDVTGNMAVMEVRLPSGYINFDAWWVKNTNPNLMEIQTLEGGTIVVFYFNSITNVETCVNFVAYRVSQVFDLRPGNIRVVDYYDTFLEGSLSFIVPQEKLSDLCYVC